jgi:hypothetical protein
LTEALKSKLAKPVSSPEFDLLAATNEALGDVGLTTSDSGGRLSFYGQDPILPSPHRFGTTYQGMTDQIVMSRTREAYQMVLVPHGLSKPDWLPS